MNPRTITHNAQLDNLIDTLKPSPAKPAPLSSTWPVLHEQAMAVAKVANAAPWHEEPPSDGGFFALVMGTGLMLIFMCRYLERSSIK